MSRFIDFTLPSTVPGRTLHGFRCVPEGQARAVLQLSHGMVEYIDRYRPLAEYLADRGILVTGHDHLGHGASIRTKEDYGYFAEPDGNRAVLADLHAVTVLTKELYPNLPYFLLGHSMGSFYARQYLCEYGRERNGAIIMGTAGGVTGSAPLRKLLDILCHSKDSRFRPEISKKLAFGLFNVRFHHRRTPNDWLSRWDENVDRFNADPLCNFTFTVAGFRDLLNALMCANSDCVIENTPTDLPMLFMSGSMDPVGEYGAGVRAACMRYLEHGCMVNIHIYPEARHELLFELNRDNVMEDILDFIRDHIK